MKKWGITRFQKVKIALQAYGIPRGKWLYEGWIQHTLLTAHCSIRSRFKLACMITGNSQMEDAGTGLESNKKY